MRVRLCAILTAGLLWGGAAFAQDLCENIRLSAAEQLECRARLANALGEGDRLRTQQEYEDRIRRAHDALIAPPVLSSPPPTSTPVVPGGARPDVPRAPAQPAAPSLPGAPAPEESMPAPPAGSLASPGGAPPAGTAIVPDLTAPDPAASPLPPISPLPASPTGAPPSR